MKRFLFFSINLFIGIYCFGQELEVCTSINTSSEQRFQGATGFGFQYQQDMNRKYIVGFGVHYIFNNTNFYDFPWVDEPNSEIIEKINSQPQKFSIRLNVQRLLKDNENVSLSIGPEISYNFIWGQDQGQFQNIESNILNPTWFQFSQKINLVYYIGFGLISKVAVKKIFIPQLSLCFTFRPEFLIGDRPKLEGGNPVFSNLLGFTEFQIGIQYRFKQKSTK